MTAVALSREIPVYNKHIMLLVVEADAATVGGRFGAFLELVKPGDRTATLLPEKCKTWGAYNYWSCVMRRFVGNEWAKSFG